MRCDLHMAYLLTPAGHLNSPLQNDRRRNAAHRLVLLLLKVLRLINQDWRQHERKLAGRQLRKRGRCYRWSLTQ